MANVDTTPIRARVFLLSPAKGAGVRAGLLTRAEARFELALRLRHGGAPLGDVYAFVSGLYFRGKLAYARAFARPPAGTAAALVIAPGRGLVPADTTVGPSDLATLGAVPVDPADERFAVPLRDAAAALARSLGRTGEAVLLGSVATGKYVDLLLDALGDRLVFPSEFVGRGDLSRGGLMLRSARAGVELRYEPVVGAVRRGARPPRLPALPRSSPRRA